MRRVLLAVLAASTLAGAARAAPLSLSAEDVIAGRQAGFDLQQGIATAMKAAIESGQSVKPMAPAAKALAAWAEVIPGQFPPGTETGHDTAARPEIWSDPAGFARAARASQQAAQSLATLAQADDKAGFADQFAATAATCGACHRAYRVRRE